MFSARSAEFYGEKDDISFRQQSPPVLLPRNYNMLPLWYSTNTANRNGCRNGRGHGSKFAIVSLF